MARFNFGVTWFLCRISYQYVCFSMVGPRTHKWSCQTRSAMKCLLCFDFLFQGLPGSVPWPRQQSRRNFGAVSGSFCTARRGGPACNAVPPTGREWRHGRAMAGPCFGGVSNTLGQCERRDRQNSMPFPSHGSGVFWGRQVSC